MQNPLPSKVLPRKPELPLKPRRSEAENPSDAFASIEAPQMWRGSRPDTSEHLFFALMSDSENSDSKSRQPSGIKLLMVFGWYPNWCPMGFVLIGIDAKSCEKLRLVRDLPIA